MAAPSEVKSFKCIIHGIEVKSSDAVLITLEPPPEIPTKHINSNALIADGGTSIADVVELLKKAAFKKKCGLIASFGFAYYVDYTKPAAPRTLWYAYGTGIAAQ